MPERHLFTSESVTEGHPDKIADQISDAILDAILSEDPRARVACETMVTTGLACVAGEITTHTYVHFPDIVRRTIDEIGYNDATFGFDSKTCAVISTIDKQSPDIAMGVDTGGAGDQGMMFGYATDETPELMPMPILLAHRLTRALAERRKSGDIKWLRPDGKAQVTVAYEGGEPVRVETVVVSTQHADAVAQDKIRKTVIAEIIEPALPPALFDKKKTTYHINPTGRFEIGGPKADTGLTGRKIIVDSYGGMAPHGGGAFSGKDPTKVDRSAAYMLGRTYANMAGACWFLKRPQEGIDYLKKAITYYERTDHKTNAADGYNNLGINLILIGQWDRAQEALQRALSLATEVDERGEPRRSINPSSLTDRGWRPSAWRSSWRWR